MATNDRLWTQKRLVLHRSLMRMRLRLWLLGMQHLLVIRKAGTARPL